VKSDVHPAWRAGRRLMHDTDLSGLVRLGWSKLNDVRRLVEVDRRFLAIGIHQYEAMQTVYAFEAHKRVRKRLNSDDGGVGAMRRPFSLYGKICGIELQQFAIDGVV